MNRTNNRIFNEDMRIYSHKFTFTVRELPRDGNLLFVQKAAPNLMLWQNKLLAQRTVVIDYLGRLGLIVGGLDYKTNTGVMQIDNNAMIKFYEKKGVMNPNIKRLIEIQTVTDPDNYAGSCKVLVDGDVVLMYMVDKRNGVY